MLFQGAWLDRKNSPQIRREQSHFGRTGCSVRSAARFRFSRPFYRTALCILPVCGRGRRDPIRFSAPCAALPGDSISFCESLPSASAAFHTLFSAAGLRSALPLLALWASTAFSHPCLPHQLRLYSRAGAECSVVLPAEPRCRPSGFKGLGSRSRPSHLVAVDLSIRACLRRHQLPLNVKTEFFNYYCPSRIGSIRLSSSTSV